MKEIISTTHYLSPVGDLFLAAQEDALIGLWLTGQKYFLGTLREPMEERKDHPVLMAAKLWLDRYFAGEKPAISQLKLAPAGSDFRKAVWAALCKIPYTLYAIQHHLWAVFLVVAETAHSSWLIY